MDDDTLSLEVILRTCKAPFYYMKFLKVKYNPGTYLQPNFHRISFELDKGVFIFTQPKKSTKKFSNQNQHRIEDTVTKENKDWYFTDSIKYRFKDLLINDHLPEQWRKK